jgi:hypothetical protein
MSFSLSESATIGILLLLIFGAVSFYLYSRINYTEKRMGLMENMLLDIKMGLESMHKEEPEFVPEPVGAPRPMESSEAEPLPEEETYYQSVLAQAGENEAAVTEMEAEGTEAEGTEVVHEEKPVVSVNYESMTKDDLIALAEKRGAKVGKRPGRKDLIAALKKLDETKSGEVSGASLTSDLFPMSAALNEGDSSGAGFPVDLGAETLE